MSRRKRVDDGILYAEDVKYWRTGHSAPDLWIERAKLELMKVGATAISEMFGQDPQGRSAYMLQFFLDGEKYRIAWPVLPTRSGDQRAARTQAATLLYHDIVARCMTSYVLGKRASFLTFLMLPDGRSASQIASSELVHAIPQMLMAPRDESD